MRRGQNTQPLSDKMLGAGTILISCQLAVVSLLSPQSWAESQSRPNIVIIMSDDIGYSDLGCFGGEIRTPNLDSLAYGGLRFSNFYSENMCWVSRAAMLTGVYHRTSLSKGTIHPLCVTIPEALRQKGYQTFMSGKWHLAGNDEATVFPVDRGFDIFYGILGGAASFFAPHNLCRNRINVEHEYQDPDYYITHAISESAIRYLERADKDRPLFLYVAYTAAHWPLHALPEDIAKYKGRYAIGWDVLRQQRLARMKELGVVAPKVQLSRRHPNVPAWHDTPHKKWQQRRMEVYAAQITSMDSGIGRIIDTLKQTGRFENTLLFFTVDNGGCHVEYLPTRKGPYLPTKTRDGRPMVPGNLPDIMPGPEDTYQSYGHGWANASNTPFRLFKKYDHEGGIHTPMIAHWPVGITDRGAVVNRVAHLIDIMPTLLKATEAELPQSIAASPRIEIDGVSLMNAIRGKPNQAPRTLFFHHSQGKAIRKGPWKLVQRSNEPWELYDLQSDPNELESLSETLPQKTEQLRRQWLTWQRKQIERSK